MTDFRLRASNFWLRFMIPAWAVVRGYEWVAPVADQLRWAVVQLAVDWWAVDWSAVGLWGARP